MYRRKKKLGMHRVGSEWSGKKMVMIGWDIGLGMVLESLPSLVSEKCGGRASFEEESREVLINV